MGKNDLAMMGATLALDLVHFALTARGLEGKNPEQVLALWRATSEGAKAVGAEWDAFDKKEPAPGV